MNQQQQESNLFNVRESFDVVRIASEALAWCLWPFFHRYTGVRAPGAFGVAAFILIAVVAGHSQDACMQWFFLAWVVAVVRCRIEAYQLHRKGVRIHSEHRGDPFWGNKVPGVKTLRGGWNAEAVVCFLGGIGLLAVSETLGGFLMIAAVGILILNGMEGHIERKRKIMIDDRVIEMQHQAERMYHDF